MGNEADLFFNLAKHYVIISRVLVTSPQPSFLVRRTWDRFQSFAAFLSRTDPTNALSLPVLPTPASSSTSTSTFPSRPNPPPTPILQCYVRSLVIALSTPPHDADPHVLLTARKKLEAFLLGISDKVSKKDLANYFEMAELDDEDRERERREWVEMGKRAKALRSTWANYKRALIDGGSRSFVLGVVGSLLILLLWCSTQTRSTHRLHS